MITEKTVLILGAGASMGFHYPSGPQLKQLIRNMLGNKSRSEYRTLHQLVPEAEKIQTFVKALSKSGRTSIDAFLENRRDLMQIGKYAIAIALLKKEVETSLFATENEITKEKNWYDYLFGRMNGSFDEFANNKIAFVTFNYDRSLEHYLFESLKNSYGKTDEEVTAVLKKIPIIHVHGQLGNLLWQGANGRAYKSTTHAGDAINAAEGATRRVKVTVVGSLADSTRCRTVVTRIRRQLPVVALVAVEGGSSPRRIPCSARITPVGKVAHRAVAAGCRAVLGRRIVVNGGVVHINSAVGVGAAVIAVACAALGVVSVGSGHSI